jgi:two-component system chemotaxis response regulator CheB
VNTQHRVVMRRAPAKGYHPSVDTLFESVASVYPEAAIGIVLTGIGSDGVAGAAKLAAAGGVILSQDEESSVVFGMPGAIARAGLASVIGPPAELARSTLELVEKGIQLKARRA